MSLDISETHSQAFVFAVAKKKKFFTFLFHINSQDSTLLKTLRKSSKKRTFHTIFDE